MQFLITGSDESDTTILLAHGAGAPMDSDAMNAIARALVARDFRVARFEFEYMAARRMGRRKPPPKAALLIGEYEEAAASLAHSKRLIVGGKSMGGRVASMVAANLHKAGMATGLLCLGYPFHPPGKPDSLRTAHLADLGVPTLIVQGSRDPLGNRDEVAGYRLSPSIEVMWLEDGDHDFRPRKSVTGLSAADHINSLSRAVREWSDSL